ncbi:hypothetical protein EA58_04970 [Photobacterium galatheae]|uniref:Uncharacterized protein n=1 Tax=Photobacterium galatheae TaxID=1654360 RepID=A0A066RZC4_9GAMM|nr:hypothetical protein EA58_04970 [Photobacterium galatheae]
MERDRLSGVIFLKMLLFRTKVDRVRSADSGETRFRNEFWFKRLPLIATANAKLTRCDLSKTNKTKRLTADKIF